MTNRRKFIKQVAAAGILSSIPNVLLPQQKCSDRKIWACLLQLSVNMWKGHLPYLQLSESLWNDALEKMANVGLNMVVIDLGDGVKYESHPEIAVNNAWSTTRLRDELAKIRKMGLEPIPKLNFSACHDAWLGVYSRMVSTKEYYEVCRDLIAEVCDIFNTPRFFHLGMDEENEVDGSQKDYDLIVIRQDQLFWGDFYFLIGEVERNGVRPWVWSDLAWHKHDQFFREMPKSVLQSNWYYDGGEINLNTLPDLPALNKTMVKTYSDLEAYGYDQVPCGSNHSNPGNFGKTVEYCKKIIDPSRLYGFIQTPWRITTEEFREHILKSIELAGNAKNWFDKNNQ